MIKILIVDDHPVVRRGIKQILGEYRDLEVAGEAGSVKQAITHLISNRFDIVVLDLSMPERGGLELLEQIRRQYSSLPVLVLSHSTL